jgi:hypothetical protein
MSLGQPWDVITSRWIPGVEASLSAAVDELDDGVRRQLAAQLQIELADANWESYEQSEWEAYVAKRVDDLLRLDRPLDAIRILRRRSARLPGSPLDWLHSRALFRIGHRLEAFELAQQVIGAALGEPVWADDRRSRGIQWMLDELLEWFVNPAMSAMPAPEVIRRRVQWFDELHPLHVVADRLFVGRERELAFLDNYTFGQRSDEGPLVVHGVGGAGKSALVAKFALDRLDSISLAYVDAALQDLPIITTVNPVAKLLTDMARQLTLQGDGRPLEALPAEADADAVLGAIEALHRADRPLLLIIDNVDLLQYRTRPLVLELLGAFERLRLRVPACRPVLISRSDLEGIPHRSLIVGRLDAEATRAYLAAEQVPPGARDRIAQLADGNALALRLAAAVVKREGENALNQLSLNEGSIAATLLDRIFSRIQDPRVRSIARAGLVVQRITPEIVRLVLGPAANVAIDDAATAEELFELLAREPALFSVAEQGIRPRGDIRRLVTSGLSHEQPDLVRRVHEAAVAYYSSQSHASSQDQYADRAEEIYHRLMAGQSADDIDARWLPGVEVALRGLVGDLAGPPRAYLAARLGLDLPEVDWSTTDQPTWERHVATRAQELIALKRFGDAIELLRERSTRLSRSPLLALEAEALLRSGDPHSALEVVRRGLSLWPDDPALPALLAECERLLGAAANQSTTSPAAAVTVNDTPTRQLRQDVGLSEVIDALTAVLTTTTEILLLAKDAGLPMHMVPVTGSMREVVSHVVEFARNEGQLDRLVEVAAATFAGRPEFSQFVAQRTIRIDRSAADPIAAIRLGTSGLMFGRFALRDFLRGALSEVPRFRVLLVAGAAGSGKTHTARLADHVARTTSRLRFVLQRYESPALSLGDYLFQLYSLIGWRWEGVAETDRSPDATVRILADRFRARAEAEKQPLLLMFEVGRDVDPTVADFVAHLASDPRRLSLIVTGLDEERLRASGAPLMVERLAMLSSEEVEDGMRQAVRELGLPEQLATEAVRRAFDTVPRDERFNANVAREMHRVLNTAIEQATQQT